MSYALQNHMVSDPDGRGYQGPPEMTEQEVVDSLNQPRDEWTVETRLTLTEIGAKAGSAVYGKLWASLEQAAGEDPTTNGGITWPAKAALVTVGNLEALDVNSADVQGMLDAFAAGSYPLDAADAAAIKALVTKQSDAQHYDFSFSVAKIGHVRSARRQIALMP